MRSKRVVIVFSLVDESVEVKNTEIEKDIMDELSEGIVPWCRQLEEVIVEG